MNLFGSAGISGASLDAIIHGIFSYILKMPLRLVVLMVMLGVTKLLPDTAVGGR